jgi:hypothetical protein
MRKNLFKGLKMSQTKFKNMLKDKNTSKDNRTTLKTLLGEFDRINDGKPLTNDQCMSVIKKFVKNIDISLKAKYNASLENEKTFLTQFLPKKATKDQMEEVIDFVLKNNTFKNKMQAMKPCIDLLNEKGYDVNKKELSDLLKG